ncbi:hypothetical protein EON65_52565 [archaeon]|nr:MAG: hypothetical protein EON65_52565 [archaeon]
MSVQNNLLTGLLPWTIGHMFTSATLNFANNQLFGGIPENLYFMFGLSSWICSISGTISSSLYSFNNINIRVLQLDHNALIGSIPAELSNLLWLENLICSIGSQVLYPIQ